MSKKKASRNRIDSNLQREIHLQGDHPAAEPERMDREHETLSEKFQILKNLNSRLVKETVEGRNQVDFLDRKMEAELARFANMKMELETELNLESQQGIKLMLERSVICCFIDSRMREICGKVEKVLSERDGKVRALTEKNSELDGVVESERAILTEVVRERDLMRSKFDALAEKVSGLKENLRETQKARREVEEGFERMKVESEELRRVKDDRERVLEDAVRERGNLEAKLAQAQKQKGFWRLLCSGVTLGVTLFATASVAYLAR